MKRLLALSLALMFILAGCGTGRLEKAKVNTHPPKITSEKSDKLQEEAEQAAAEIDKILDSLEDIDESKLDL